MGKSLYKSHWVVIALILMLSGCATTKPTGDKFPKVLFGPEPVFEEMKSFQRLIASTEDSPEFEKARIEYLFERLSQTRYNFVRNDKAYSNARAVIHLRWKYVRFANEAKTAEDFVNHVASGSRMSGNPYLMKTQDGSYILIKLMFYDELALLAEAFKAYQEKVEAEFGRLEAEKENITLNVDTEELKESPEEADISTGEEEPQEE